MLRRHHSLVLTVFGTVMLGACGNSSLPAERVSAPGNGGNDAPVTEDRCGEHPWCDTSLSPAERSALVIDAMTTDEKIAFLAGDNLTGIAGFEGTHTGTSNGIERLGIPTVYYSDGPMGVRSGQGTAFPAPIALAATWDPDIAQRYGAAVATVLAFWLFFLLRSEFSARVWESFPRREQYCFTTIIVVLAALTPLLGDTIGVGVHWLWALLLAFFLIYYAGTVMDGVRLIRKKWVGRNNDK